MSETRAAGLDTTWNPTRGCSHVSEGCRHCYAERDAARSPGLHDGLVKVKHLKTSVTLRRRPDGSIDSSSKFERVARWTGEVRMARERLADPLHWKKPRRVFVNNMSDLFHESLTNEQIAAVFGVMAAAPQHTFRVLTKRASAMQMWFSWLAADARADRAAGSAQEGTTFALAHAAAHELGDGSQGDRDRWYFGILDMIRHVTWPLPNVWLGVSVENQATADARIPALLGAPAAVRFLSCEPLLGPIDLRGQRGIDWVTAGCEHGPRARWCDAAWLRGLRDQCNDIGVPFFLKQAAQASGVTAGFDSKHKPGGVIELPYLDGVKHTAIPGTDRR